MTLGLSLDSLTSVSPMCTVMGGMPDSVGVHNNSGCWDPLNLHITNDAHQALAESPVPIALPGCTWPSRTYSQGSRVEEEKRMSSSRAHLRTPELRPREALPSRTRGTEMMRTKEEC